MIWMNLFRCRSCAAHGRACAIPLQEALPASGKAAAGGDRSGAFGLLFRFYGLCRHPVTRSVMAYRWTLRCDTFLYVYAAEPVGLTCLIVLC